MSLSNFMEPLAFPEKSPEDATVKLCRTIGHGVFLGRKMIAYGDFMQLVLLYISLQLICMKIYIIFTLMMNMVWNLVKIVI